MVKYDVMVFHTLTPRVSALIGSLAIDERLQSISKSSNGQDLDRSTKSGDYLRNLKNNCTLSTE